MEENQLPRGLENDREEVGNFLKEHPPKKQLTSQEIDDLIIGNSELILDIMKENAQKKNRNITTSNQLNLTTKLERNLIKLIKLTNLGVATDPMSAANARQHLAQFSKKKR